MQEILFEVTPGDEDEGGFVARWDNQPGLGGIATQGESLDDLMAMIRDAISGYFEDHERPIRFRLHFAEDPVVTMTPALQAVAVSA